MYAKLNDEQKQAVDALQGPVIVIAGPGTGKTQILALRITNLLHKKIAHPEQILALTFSESGVSAMRKRLIEAAGTQGYYVPVYTFHGFCQSIIQSHPEEFSAVSSAGNMSEVARVQMGEAILREGPFTLVRPLGDQTYYLRPMLSEIANFKKEGIGPELFLEKVLAQEKELLARPDLYHEKGAYKGKMKAAYRDEQQAIERNKELAVFYAMYQEQLRKEKRYDYEDMILFVMQKLAEDEAFQSRIGALYEFVLVDEHQDTNSAQNKVVELLLAEKEIPNVFVVGDEKQAIFRFQGASIENFLYFSHKYPGAKVITLKENYRSGQKILDSTHALIARRSKNIQHIFPNISEALNAATQKDAELPAIWEFESPQSEHYFIAEAIQKLLDEGTEPREIAIIFRENREAADIMDMLSRLNIPHAFEGTSNMFEDPFVQKALRVLRYAGDVGNETHLMETLGIEAFGIPVLDRWKLMALRGELVRQNVGKLVHSADIMRTPENYKDVQWENPAALKNAYKFLSHLGSMAGEYTLPQIFEETLRGIGLVSFMKEHGDDPAMLLGARKLSEEIKKFVQERMKNDQPAELRDFLEYLDLFQTHGIRLNAAISHGNAQAVRLMTAHRAKGLEFDYVFIPHALHSFWGGRRKRSLFHLPSFAAFDTAQEDAVDDDRRLFFVAMTRARKHVAISYPTFSAEGKELVPSIFVNELLEKDDEGKTYAEKFSGAPFDKEAHEKGEVFLAPRGESLLPLQEQQDFVKDLFMRRGFAVTHLNNYLECPWKYFYANLLKMPQAETLNQMYGTSVHSALQQFFDKGKDGVVPAREELTNMFVDSLRKQILTESERKQLLERGNKTLSLYYDFYKSSWNFNAQSELGFAFPLSETIRLTGKIDKLEMQDDGSVIVVDYKTGKPKTRGQIEKEESGNLKRQLAFYTFFLTHYPRAVAQGSGGAQQEHYRVKSVELDFVQPDAKGKFHKEAFVVSPGERNVLEAEIRRVADEITTLAFWDKRCENEKCEWCALRFA